MAFEVIFSDEALADLQSIFNYIADAADFDTAVIYDARIRTVCARLEIFPRRGTPHPEIRPGLRTIPFERRARIAYEVEADAVRIIQILYAGRESGAGFQRE